MRVKHVIEYLKDLNPEAEVRLGGKDGELCLFVKHLESNDKVVWLDGANENDLKNELRERYEALEREEISEKKIFMCRHLLETDLPETCM